MNWNNILEGIISGVSATLISSAIIYILKKIFEKKTNKENSGEVQRADLSGSVLNNPFLISLFLASFVIVLTFFSLVYQWQTFNYIYLIVADFGLVLVTNWIYNNQCPECNKIFKKKLINKETLKDEKRPYHYRDCTIYLYSDDSEKDRKYHGQEKQKWRLGERQKNFMNVDLVYTNGTRYLNEI